MIYKLGSVSELAGFPLELPEKAKTELYIALKVLDAEYGAGRDYDRDDGGYVLIAESVSDLPALKEIIDYDTHPCEWATRQGSYLSALYILTNDFAIMVFLPISIAPAPILKELED